MMMRNEYEWLCHDNEYVLDETLKPGHWTREKTTWSEQTKVEMINRKDYCSAGEWTLDVDRARRGVTESLELVWDKWMKGSRRFVNQLFYKDLEHDEWMICP